MDKTNPILVRFVNTDNTSLLIAKIATVVTNNALIFVKIVIIAKIAAFATTAQGATVVMANEVGNSK
ncbi:hypothetical protein OCF65_28255 [Bacillus toyonensis]|uniref:hypothetical protein n=1 Tax=Bacillus toyonensis TaxID=155322 RepID=UPI0021D087BF|nr:hypothetical protein [Bacillus toyonensis]MCU5584261.1 hypothetical protein [Bacillus toyonensis]